MTIIKQKSVVTNLHARNLEKYINDKDALLRDGLNLSIDKDWFLQMTRVRKWAGHDKPARKGCKNTIMYHQVIAFLPEEADMNGGKMTPRACMAYAKEYAKTRYPNQQIAFALHKEFCKKDGTYRYACHLAINRTNLETQTRLDEGLYRHAMKERVKTIRKMDDKWGLHAVQEGEVNSVLHSRQVQGAAKSIVQDERKSYKENTREWALHYALVSESVEQFMERMKSVGFSAELRDGRVMVFDPDTAPRSRTKQREVLEWRKANPDGTKSRCRKETGIDHRTIAKWWDSGPLDVAPDAYRFDLSKMDARLTPKNLTRTFEQNRLANTIDTAFQREQERMQKLDEMRSLYRATLEANLQEYHRVALESKGTDFKDFPRFKYPHVPEALREDPETRHDIATANNSANRVLRRYASNVPEARRSGQYGAASTGVQPRNQEQVQAQSRNKNNQEKGS